MFAEFNKNFEPSCNGRCHTERRGRQPGSPRRYWAQPQISANVRCIVLSNVKNAQVPISAALLRFIDEGSTICRDAIRSEARIVRAAPKVIFGIKGECVNCFIRQLFDLRLLRCAGWSLAAQLLASNNAHDAGMLRLFKARRVGLTEKYRSSRRLHDYLGICFLHGITTNAAGRV